MKEIQLSVALATFNEQENIGRCLSSVKDLADEIVIVDGTSTDKTVEIAKSYGAKVEVRENPPIFHINKQRALDHCLGEWILQLDADEVVTPELAMEIKGVIGMTEVQLEARRLSSSDTYLFLRHQNLLEKRDGQIGRDSGEMVAFFVSRKNYFLGSFLRYGGVYPDGVIRLVKKGKARFPCKSVHEQIQIQGRVGWLENSLFHFDSPNFYRYILRANKYTDLTAEEFEEKKVSLNLCTRIYYLVLKPLKIFLTMWIRHKGFLDGFPGFVFALFSALHFPIAYLKYWERKND